MLKRICFIVTFVLTLMPIETPGKDYDDVIYLNDGSVIRGVIVEEVPGETYKIEIAGGSVFVFTADEVAEVTRKFAEEKDGVEDIESIFQFSGKYRPFLFGFNAVLGRYSGWRGLTLYGGEFLVGWRVHEIYAAALGFGYTRTGGGDDYYRSYAPTYKFVPIYIHNRITYLRTDMVGLYGKFDIGYGLVYVEDLPGQHGGLLYGFGQGFEFGPPGFHGDVSVGLRSQSFESGSSTSEFISHFGFSI